MKRIFYLPVLLLLLVLTSCKKDPIKNLDGNESIVYITEHDSTANFSSYHSFRIADSVNVINSGTLVKRELTSFDAALIDGITQAMTNRGYQLTTDESVTPDIGINVTKLITDHTGIIDYYDYWGGYGSYWDPYYWGYGGYDYYFPYAFGTYTFQEGALSVDMVDLKNPDTGNNRLNSLWTGLARGSGIFSNSSVNQTVQSFFDQSPYLQK